MAGFYGNIRNATSNSFKFDRVYSNRAIMDANAENDGVFGGRYALVEYDLGLTENYINPISATYYQFNNDGLYYSKEPILKLEEKEVNIVVENQDELESHTINSYSLAMAQDDVPLEAISRAENGQLIVQILEQQISFIDPFLSSNTTYVKELDEEGIYYYKDVDTGVYYDKPYIFDDAGKLVINTRIHAAFFKEDGSEPEISRDYDKEEAYSINYTIDKVVYGNGRGYDSTVWRKMYVKDEETGIVKAKYVNIAELNSVVPTFAVSADVPSDMPVQPHFDKDSTNVYYNLHLQSPWGFRIGESKTNLLQSVELQDPSKPFPSASELESGEGEGHRLIKYNDNSDVVINTYYVDYQDNNNIVYDKQTYNGAIYLNLDGFNSEYSNHSKDAGGRPYEIGEGKYEAGTNAVSFEATGVSGKLYNDDLGDGHYNKTKWEDTKELRVILPALGDTVATMWDKLYGNGSNNKNKKRTPYMKWEDANYPYTGEKLRLITGPNDGYYYSPQKYTDYVESDRDSNSESIDEVESLAGAINSVHDLMGMIITKDEPIPIEPGKGNNFYKIEGDDTVYIPGASTKNIYYSRIEDENAENGETHEFYYAGNGYGYEELKNDPENNIHEKTFEWLHGDGTEGYAGYYKIPSDRLKDYGKVNPKQYIKSNLISLKLDESKIASANTSYYELPKKLRYVGNLMDSSKKNRYYVQEQAQADWKVYGENGIVKKSYRGNIHGYITTDDYSDKNKIYYSIHGNESNTGIACVYEVNKNLEPYFDDINYYIYDENTDKYINIKSAEAKNFGWEWKQNMNATEYSAWVEKWNNEQVYRDGVFVHGRYKVYADGYYYAKEIFAVVDENGVLTGEELSADIINDIVEKGEPVPGTNTPAKETMPAMKLLTFNTPDRPVVINNLLLLKNEIDAINKNNNVRQYTVPGHSAPYRYKKIYGNNRLYVESGTTIEPNENGQYVTKTVYTGYLLSSFLFDNNDLYEYLNSTVFNETITEDSEEYNKNYFVKSGFTRPSQLPPFRFDGADDNNTVKPTNSEMPDFYKLTVQAARYYEKGKYFVFSSKQNENPQISSSKDKWNTKDDSVIVNSADYPNVFDDNEPTTHSWNVKNTDITDLVINTAEQDIYRLQLSIDDYDENYAYWENVDDPDYIWDKESDPFEQYIVAEGADDFNIGIEKYIISTDTERQANKKYYIISNGEYVEYDGAIPSADKIYEKNPLYRDILYYTDNVFYRNLGGNEYEIASSENGYHFNENNNDLYKQRELYIINIGNFNDKFNLYQRWNLNLINTQEDFDHYFSEEINKYRYVETYDEKYDPNKNYYILNNDEYELFDGEEFAENETYYERYGGPIVLGKRVNTLVKKVLPGFARDINTMHGLLLRINEILQSGDIRTRDINTVQGCINTMHDILDIFQDLTPGELYGIDRYGRLSPISLSGNDGKETWIDIYPEYNDNYIETQDNQPRDGKIYYVRNGDIYEQFTGNEFDPNTIYYEKEEKTILHITHNTTDEFDNFIKYEDEWPASNRPVIYEFNDGVYEITEDSAKVNGKIYYIKEKQDLIDALEELKEEGNAEKVHDVFGFDPDDGTGNKVILHSPVIDNAGHVIGAKETTIKIADILLETNGNATIGTLTSPSSSGNVSITSSDTLRDALNKLITHINNGADNITLNKYDEYYNDIITDNTSTFPYVPTEDTAPKAGKVYYIKDGDIYKVYTADPWPENHPTIYEKLTTVENGDNLNDAIAKLQWQLDHIVYAPLTDLNEHKLPSTYDPYGPNASINETDSLGQGLWKLQQQLETSISGSDNTTGITNNFAAIIRTNGLVPTTQAQGGNGTVYNSHIRSGWIWIDTAKHYVYIKTEDGYKTDNNHLDEPFADDIDKNFWELLNAWQ